MPITIKATLNDDTRRLTVEALPSLEDLRALLRARFGIAQQTESIGLKWQDDDDDFITIAETEDLTEALAHDKLRLFLHVSPQVKVNQQVPASTSVRECCAQLAAALDVDVPASFLDRLAKALTKAAPLFRGFVRNAENLEAAFKDDNNSTSEAVPELPPFFAHIKQAAEKAAAQFKESAEKAHATHWGVTCDASGVHPIVGTRWHKRGEDYDLCDAEYAKLPDEQKTAFERIDTPQFFKGVLGGASRPVDFQQSPFPGCFQQLFATMDKVAQAATPTEQKKPSTDTDDTTKPEETNNSTIVVEHVPAPQAEFVADVTLPDGTEVMPGTSVTKTWAIRNSGTTVWPTGMRLVNHEGDNLPGTDVEVEVPAIAAGEEVNLSVSWMAPEAPGQYKSQWQLVQPQGKKMRFFLWLEVSVAAPTDTTTTGTEDAAPYSISDAVVSMGLREEDLSASILAEIEHAVNENTDQAEGALILESAVDAERLAAEAERLAAEEAVKAEAERLAAEEAAKAEAERLAAEEAAKAEAERLAAEAAANAEAERLAAEAAAKAEAERLAAEAAAKAEAERLAAEAQRLEAEKLDAEAASRELMEPLLAMGFTESAVIGALDATQGSLEHAANWLFVHADELEGEVTITEPSSQFPAEWQNHLDDLLGMGFEEDKAKDQLVKCNGDLKTAVKELVDQERQGRSKASKEDMGPA